MSKIIYTIGREFGSGGREIAKKLSSTLNIPYYDKELIARAAKDSGLAEEIFHMQDEKPTNSFMYSLVMDIYSFTGHHTGNNYLEMPLNQKVFLAQFDTIKKIASEGSCVIVGRCADYALADEENCVNVFIYADREYRIKRVADYENIPVSKAKEILNRNDKERASYYNFYSGKKWGDSRSYDICLNSGKLGQDRCVDILLGFAEKR